MGHGSEGTPASFPSMGRKHHLQIHESWAWAKEQHANATEFNKVHGMARVSRKNAEALVAESGSAGCFIDVPKWADFPKYVTEWIKQLAKETYADYLSRASVLGSKFGLTFGLRSLGKRVERDANTEIARAWVLRAPHTWTPEQARIVLGQQFKQVRMIHQHRSKQGSDFMFRGSHTTDHDILAIPGEAENGKDTLVYWCKWATMKRKTKTQTIKTRSSWSLQPPADPFAAKEKVAQDPPPADSTNGGQSSQGVEDDKASQAAVTAEDTKTGKSKRAERKGAAEAANKRLCAEQRAVPPELQTKKVVPADGNCLFSALAEEYAFATKQETRMHAAQLRAEIVQLSGNIAHHRANRQVVWHS